MAKYWFTGSLLLVLLFFSCKTAKNSQTNMFPVFDKEGHRGCRGLMPENTIPAMIKAIDLGVTTLEMDVVFTADKIPVLSHEPFFNHEITSSPGGKDIQPSEEHNLNIYRMSFAETQQYDVGMKPNTKFPKQQKIKTTKPSLSALIDSVEIYLSIQNLPKVFYNIETKTSPATDNIFHPEPAEFVELLMKVIKTKEIEKRVIIQSFDVRTLQILHKNYPDIKTSLLIDASDKSGLEDQLNRLGFTPTIYSPAYSLVDKALVDGCHEKKIKVVPWTVNDGPTISRLKDIGVDGIITDYPDLFKELL